MKPLPIVVKANFKCSVNELWSALTEVETMRQWFFQNIPEFEAEVGFRTEFNIDAGSRQFLHKWKVLKVIPNKSILVEWLYRDYYGNSTIEFSISQQIDGLELSITASGIESFPQDIPEFTRESCQAGWEYFINRLSQLFSYN